MTCTGSCCAPSHVPSQIMDSSRSIPRIRNCWKRRTLQRLRNSSLGCGEDQTMKRYANTNCKKLQFNIRPFSLREGNKKSEGKGFFYIKNECTQWGAGTASWKGLSHLTRYKLIRIQGVPVRMVNELEIDLAWTSSIASFTIICKFACLFSVYTDGMISGNLDLQLDFTMTQFESGRVFDSQPLKKAGKRRCWTIHPSASVGMISKQ